MLGIGSRTVYDVPFNISSHPIMNFTSFLNKMKFQQAEELQEQWRIANRVTLTL